MQYQYGASIRVIPPGGQRTIMGQLGEMTEQGPIIHIQGHGIRMSADQLRQEGWQVPEIEQDGVLSYRAEASEIVKALLRD